MVAWIATIVALGSSVWTPSASRSNRLPGRTTKSANNPALMVPICPCRRSCSALLTEWAGPITMVPAGFKTPRRPNAGTDLSTYEADPGTVACDGGQSADYCDPRRGMLSNSQFRPWRVGRIAGPGCVGLGFESSGSERSRHPYPDVTVGQNVGQQPKVFS